MRSLLMRRGEFHFLRNILPYLDSTELKNLATSYSVLIDNPDDEAWREENEEVFMLKQWKDLEILICDRFITCDDCAAHFSHLSYCSTNLQTSPSPAMLIEFKEILLLNQHLTVTKFMYPGMTDGKCSEANHLLGMYGPAALDNKMMQTFKYPNEKKFLGVSIQKKEAVFEIVGLEEKYPIELYGEDPEANDHEEDETDNESEDEADIHVPLQF